MLEFIKDFGNGILFVHVENGVVVQKRESRSENPNDFFSTVRTINAVLDLGTMEHVLKKMKREGVIK